MIVKTNGIISLEPTADHTTLEGYFVENSSGKAAIVNAATDIPIGPILDGEDTAGRDTVAIAGAFAGTCLVKLSGTVAQFALLQLAADGTCVTDAGTGARVIVGRALQAGVSGSLIEATIIHPDPRT